MGHYFFEIDCSVPICLSFFFSFALSLSLSLLKQRPAHVSIYLSLSYFLSCTGPKYLFDAGNKVTLKHRPAHISIYLSIYIQLSLSHFLSCTGLNYLLDAWNNVTLKQRPAHVSGCSQHNFCCRWNAKIKCIGCNQSFNNQI